MLLVPDLFVAETTKQKSLLLSKHQYLGSKYFLFFFFLLDILIPGAYSIQMSV